MGKILVDRIGKISLEEPVSLSMCHRGGKVSTFIFETHKRKVKRIIRKGKSKICSRPDQVRLCGGFRPTRIDKPEHPQGARKDTACASCGKPIAMGDQYVSAKQFAPAPGNYCLGCIRRAD